MDRLISSVLVQAMRRLQKYAKLAGLPNTDEATFRAFFMEALAKAVPGVRCQTEWRRFDLLIQKEPTNALVEFKYYIYRRTFDLDGTRCNWKGGPGSKNEREFLQCVRQLRDAPFSPIHYKYLILVYEHGAFDNSLYSFDRSYGSLSRDDCISRVMRVRHVMDRTLACTALRIS